MKYQDTMSQKNIKSALINRLSDKKSVIAIVGLGYVGLPLVLRYAQVGYKVLGLDIDASKVSQLNAGRSYIAHISNEQICAVQSNLAITTDFSQVKEADGIILCVPTPLNRYREPDLSFVINTVESLIPHLRIGQVLSLESTTYPGTTEEELKSRLESHGFRVGEDFYLVYSPEREDPGNTQFDTATIPKLCGGSTSTCLEVGLALYKQVINTLVPMSSTQAAEMTKLLENIHRAVNIGLVNEMKILADKMGIDIYEVIHAASTKPFGFVPYYPGPGLGGHCLPIDPFYLTWKAREFGLHTRFIELAGEINSSMPKWVIGKVTDALNESGKAIKNSNILLLGVAYKKNVDDMRESPAVAIMEILVAKGASVAYSDPFVPAFPRMREHYFDLCSVHLVEEEIAKYDCVVIVTDHDAFDFNFIKQHARLIIDTRGVYRETAAHIVKA